LGIVLLLSTAIGLLSSFAALGLLRPGLPAPWRWQWRGVVLHCALWLMAHVVLVAVLGRPWFAMALCLAFMMLLVQVSNAKYHALREPFVFQDFEYFTDAIRHPRLYIPFLGWWKFVMIAIAVAAALAVGLWLEAAALGQWWWLGGMLLLAGVGLLISSGGEPASFQPEEDMRRLGFLGCLWCYGLAERRVLQLPDLLPDFSPPPGEAPDLLVVQSESFFDPRPLFPGIRPEVLAEFDRVSAEAIFHGRLQVPAWGANTVRSEFAFLTGASESMLGVHRFNPYRRILQAEVVSLAKVLKRAGYRTICVHPYPASFYARDRVYPHFGFDEFIDIRAFGGAERFGPYVSDAALTEKIKSLFGQGDEPVFVFVITMENHGPLHLETPRSEDIELFYADNPPAGCEDLTVYLRHLKNADRMIGDVCGFFQGHGRTARFCWYGDHVPIMSKVYQQVGEPDGGTEYFIWSNRSVEISSAETISLSRLAPVLLNALR